MTANPEAALYSVEEAVEALKPHAKRMWRFLGRRTSLSAADLLQEAAVAVVVLAAGAETVDIEEAIPAGKRAMAEALKRDLGSGGRTGEGGDEEEEDEFGNPLTPLAAHAPRKRSYLVYDSWTINASNKARVELERVLTPTEVDVLLRVYGDDTPEPLHRRQYAEWEAAASDLGLTPTEMQGVHEGAVAKVRENFNPEIAALLVPGLETSDADTPTVVDAEN